MMIYAKISSTSTFSLFLVFNQILLCTLIFNISQFQTQQLMTSKICHT